VDKKIGKLARYLPNITESKVEIQQEETKSRQDRFTVQVTLNTKGVLLRGEERGSNVHLVIDAVADMLARQIERYKGKKYRRARGVSVARQGAAAEAPVVEETVLLPPEVARVKRFPVRPMPVSVAAEQMELLGHDFFLFVNTENGSLNLLYRRNDGNYGLIEPELG